MALNVAARPMANGYAPPSLAEEEQLYEQLLRVRDAVLSGKHPQFKLSAAAIERLKAFAIPEPLAVVSEQHNGDGINDTLPYCDSSATNTTKPTAPFSATFSGLPGLHASTPSLVNGASHAQPSARFDPMFLEKSDSLVRAEVAIKRRNLETELRAQFDRKNASSNRDAADAPPALDIATILSTALARVGHVSGLQPAARPESAAASSSFDENDYYSSQVESEWSSPASASKVSDRAADASRAAAGESEAPAAQSATSGKNPLVAHEVARSFQPQGPVETDDENDEYTPPDASAFDAFDENSVVMDISQDTPLDDDDDSDYEPGEITQESNAPTPYQTQEAQQSSSRVPIIRNHLTHIAAPQPNRVSPLAVAKGPNMELELVNGRPEVVHKPYAMQNMTSRASTASPAGNGAGGSSKKRRTKKRKRDSEPSSKSKKKRDRNAAIASPPSPMYREPRIKAEPVSPPPFGGIADVPMYQQHRPSDLELVSPRYAPQVQYIEQPQPAVRYEYAQPSPTIVRVASPAAYRPPQRDNLDLRRVASLHYAQRPQSPGQQLQSPASQRTASMTYGDPRYSRPSVAPVEIQSPRYQDQPSTQYVQAEQYRSSPQIQQYQDPYGARVQSPAMMPPPAAAPRRIVVDQHGNRYYAAEPAPAPPQIVSSRASVAPVEFGYERSQSRMASSYGQPQPSTHYDPADPRMGPPPTPSRRQPSEVQYVDAHGYPVQQYATRPVDHQQVRYVEAPTSPVYQSTPRYEQMPPPAPPAREPTSPAYAPQPRSYSVRPEEMPQAQVAYARQASVAPVQYGRPEASVAPVRAMSVMPGYDHGAIALPRAYSQAPQPQPVRYVDQHGQEVYPREIRQVPQDFRYQ